VHECARHSVRFGKFDSFYFCLLFFLCLFVLRIFEVKRRSDSSKHRRPTDTHFKHHTQPLPQKVTPFESLACVTLHGVSIILIFTCGMVFSIIATRLFAFCVCVLSHWVHAAMDEAPDLPSLKCSSRWSRGINVHSHFPLISKPTQSMKPTSSAHSSSLSALGSASK
jgi:hypothetical protein